jgi:hypothetical protein
MLLYPDVTDIMPAEITVISFFLATLLLPFCPGAFCPVGEPAEPLPCLYLNVSIQPDII